MDLLTPTLHSHYTHRSSALPGSILGGLPSLSLTTKGCWMHHGGGSPSLSSSLSQQYPGLYEEIQYSQQICQVQSMPYSFCLENKTLRAFHKDH